jgi:uncharacterized protein YgbK (DUF1537 family)
MYSTPHSLPGLTLVADDFTGAADVAAGAGAHWQSRLVGHLAEGLPLPPTPLPGQAVSVNLESRHLPEANATQRLRALLGQLPDDAWFYKKCDSTLRGPIGAEVAEVRARFSSRPLLYVGAAPEMGRTVRNGQVLVNGINVAETDFARDPRFPVRTGSILELLRNSGLVPELWQPGQMKLPDAEVIVADAASRDDFRHLVQAIRGCRRTPVYAGAGSFVTYLALTRGEESVDWGKVRPPAVRPPPVRFVINGSLHPMSLRQMSEAARAGISVVTLPPRCFLGDDAPANRGEAVENLLGLLRAGEPVIAGTVAAAERAEEFYRSAKARQLDRERLHELVTGGLARLATQVLRQGRIDSFLTIGGDLASRAWRELGVNQARVRGFAHQCMPVLDAGTNLGRGMTWATKPGGYGSPELLRQILGARG